MVLFGLGLGLDYGLGLDLLLSWSWAYMGFCFWFGWLVGLSSCPLGVGVCVDPWVLVSWSWPLVPGLSLGLLIFVLVMASWS